MTDTSRLEFTIDLARRAGALATRYFRDLGSLNVESKGHQDMVSQADREVELFVRAEISKAYPADGIVGEEHSPVDGATGFVWVIDPIDGTANFVNGIPAWTVVIAVTKEGVTELGVIFEPIVGEMFHGQRGGGAFLNDRPIVASKATSVTQGSVGIGFSNRVEAANVVPLISALLSDGGVFFRNASGALMLAYVASGRLLGYIEEHMNAWDCLAGLLLIEEAGGSMIQPNPSTVLKEGTVIVGSASGVFETLREYAVQHLNI